MDAVAEHIIRARDFGVKAGELYLDPENRYSSWQELLKVLKLDVSLVYKCIISPLMMSYKKPVEAGKA